MFDRDLAALYCCRLNMKFKEFVMKVALSPMEFAKRARRLYAGKEAVVDGSLRFTYEEFFARCDKWSAALQNMGIMHGDKVAYIAPNTHTHLEGYYAVPQMGVVLVPINYRLSADDFEYIINHCGAKIVCAHPDYFDAVDGIREKLVSVITSFKITKNIMLIQA